MSHRIRLILSIFADEATASFAVRVLLEERLIACGNMIPGVRSVYRWKGTVEDASEIQVLLKTDQDHAARCMERLTELHPYEVPEILLLGVEEASAPYTAWIRDCLRDSLSQGE